MRIAIYPPVGIARLGNSAEFFIAAERADSRGTQLLTDGTEAEVGSYKDDSHRVKPQAARFHLYEVPDDGTPARPAQLPPGAQVRWSVRLVNKKDAVTRPGSPPAAPIRPVVQDARRDRVIDSGVQLLVGASAGPQSLGGTYVQTAVQLGTLRTDAAQRLLVLGPAGRSHSPTGAPIGGSFYNNRDWFDDVSDGPVTAEVTLPDGDVVTCTPAWVIVAPPDFAPPCRGIVTLYDVMLQVAIDDGRAAPPARTSFADHIRPLLERARSLQFVDNGSAWALVSDDWVRLADPSDATRALREENAAHVRAAEELLHDFSLQGWQQGCLDAWVAGNFDPGPSPNAGPAAVLTRAVLDGTVAQGFFPGIEAGIIVTEPRLYAQPFDFRFDHAALSPGDITALMALPWQADFLKCNSGWWPTQRPDIAPQRDGTRPEWLRPAMNHAGLVANVMRLGVVAPQRDGAGIETVVETGRDPAL